MGIAELRSIELYEPFPIDVFPINAYKYMLIKSLPSLFVSIANKSIAHTLVGDMECLLMHVV